MLFEAAACRETVSILEAIFFGAGEACIDIGIASLLTAVAGFIGCVVMIRFVAMLGLRRIFPRLRRKAPSTVAIPHVHAEETLQRLPYESPIQSTGAWGRKQR